MAMISIDTSDTFMPTFDFENKYGRREGKIICGIDEVGCGPLAGPVVAAAAILPLNLPPEIKSHIEDSKKMTEEQREALFDPLSAACMWACGEASVAEIDNLNILWAARLAMQRAFAQLTINIDTALVDGNRPPKLTCETVTIVKGDDKSYSIAAASILAKVTRDRMMRKLAEQFPVYGWDHNAGYGTKEHIQALSAHGVTEWHRMSFAPVRDVAAKKAV